MLNLEVPLTDTNAPIAKSGPCLRAPRRVVASLEKLNLIAVGMANNHVLDQGSSGFADTLEVLSSAGIASFGGGMTVLKRESPLLPKSLVDASDSMHVRSMNSL